MPIIKIPFADLVRGPSGAAYHTPGELAGRGGDYGLGDVADALDKVAEWDRRNDAYTTKLVHAKVDVDADKWEGEQLSRTDLNTPSAETGETPFKTLSKDYDKYLKESTEKAASSVPRTMRRKFKQERDIANAGRLTAFSNTVIDRKMAQNFVDAKSVIDSKAGGDSPDPQGAIDYARSMEGNVRSDRLQSLIDYAHSQAIMGIANLDVAGVDETGKEVTGPDMAERNLESIRGDIAPDQYDSLKGEINAIRNRTDAELEKEKIAAGAALTARYLATLRNESDKPVTPSDIENAVASGFITPARGEVMSRRLLKPETEKATEAKKLEQRKSEVRAHRIMTQALNKLVQTGDRKRYDEVYDKYLGRMSDSDATRFIKDADDVRDRPATAAEKVLASVREEADGAATKGLSTLFLGPDGVKPYDYKDGTQPEPVELAEAVGEILEGMDSWAKEHTKNDKTLDVNAYRMERNRLIVSKYQTLTNAGAGGTKNDWWANTRKWWTNMTGEPIEYQQRTLKTETPTTPEPKSQAEYDALRSGTQYHHPDDPAGRLRTKP